MTKHETIDYKELKKLMKISIAIDVKLGFYLAWHQQTITIDKMDNWNSNKSIMYKIHTNDRTAIFILLNAYAKVHLKYLNMR